MNYENFDRLTQKMDESVRVLADTFRHEQEMRLFIQTSASLVKKLQERDEEVVKLRTEVQYWKDLAERNADPDRE